MLYTSQDKTSRRGRRWAWAPRPVTSLDNPVKRYLGNRSIGHGLRQRKLNGLGRLTVRPAI